MVKEKRFSVIFWYVVIFRVALGGSVGLTLVSIGDPPVLFLKKKMNMSGRVSENNLNLDCLFFIIIIYGSKMY